MTVDQSYLIDVRRTQSMFKPFILSDDLKRGKRESKDWAHRCDTIIILIILHHLRYSATTNSRTTLNKAFQLLTLRRHGVFYSFYALWIYLLITYYIRMVCKYIHTRNNNYLVLAFFLNTVGDAAFLGMKETGFDA